MNVDVLVYTVHKLWCP